MGGWLENWRVILISAFNYVIVEVVAEIGKSQNCADSGNEDEDQRQGSVM